MDRLAVLCARRFCRSAVEERPDWGGDWVEESDDFVRVVRIGFAPIAAPTPGEMFRITRAEPMADGLRLSARLGKAAAAADEDMQRMSAAGLSALAGNWKEANSEFQQGVDHAPRIKLKKPAACSLRVPARVGGWGAGGNVPSRFVSNVDDTPTGCCIPWREARLVNAQLRWSL